MLDQYIHHLIWRYFTGAHWHGKRVTNATWFKRGTLPKHHVTWWTGKPRIHRMAYRWIIILVPVGWVILFESFHYWTSLVTIGLAPYVLHYVWHSIQAGAKKNVRIPLGNPTDANVTSIIQAPQEKLPEVGTITDLVFEPLAPQKKKGA